MTIAEPAQKPSADSDATSAMTLAPMLPENARAASTSGRSDVASDGSVPMATICTST